MRSFYINGIVNFDDSHLLCVSDLYVYNITNMYVCTKNKIKKNLTLNVQLLMVLCNIMCLQYNYIHFITFSKRITFKNSFKLSSKVC